MEHDDRRRRFFAYLNLFVAAMLLLVLASDYLAVFLGWEGVGLASYLLIGFWQQKDSAAVAAKKAFVVNRVGDLGMALAIMLMFKTFGIDHVRGRLGRHARRLGRHRHRPRAAAPARRLRQVRAGPAAELVARRDGGPDPGVGADPRRDHGDGRRLPDRPVQLRLRPVRCRPGLRDRRRPRHAPLGCDHRMRQGRHQEGAGRLDHEPDRLHDARRRSRPGRLRPGDLPPADARLLQGQPVPQRRLGDARHERRGRHAALRRAPEDHARDVPDVHLRLSGHHRHPAVRRLLVQGPDHRGGLRSELLHRARRPHRSRHHRVLHDARDDHDLDEREALGQGRPPARVAAR